MTGTCECNLSAVDHEKGECEGLPYYVVIREGVSLKVCVDCKLGGDDTEVARIEQDVHDD